MKFKNIILFTVVFLIAVNFVNAQQKISLPAFTEPQTIEQVDYKLDPQPLLEKIYKKIGFDPAKVELDNSLKKSAHNFVVGSPEVWKAANFNTDEYYDVPSTCRVVGANCYIFVEDAIWGTDVTQDAVNAVANAFDYSTPANPNKGIYQTNVETFGNPPNVDGDSKIIILILDIKDSYAGPGTGYVAGYFTSLNQITNPSSNLYPYSNKSEFYYLDGVQSKLNTEAGVEGAMGTTAHEFQHMIHYNYIQGATTFFNECFSLTAEIVNGYDLYSPSRYANESNIWLFEWRTNDNVKVLNDYSRAARFGLYLLEQFGSQLFTRYLANMNDGVFALSTAINQVSTSGKTFFTLLPDWFVANYLNDKSVNSFWGYNYPNLPQMTATEYFNPNASYSGTISNHSAQYFTFKAGSNLSINFNNNNKSAIKIKAIKYGNGAPVVENVTANTNYSVPDFGSTYSEVSFIVYLVDAAEANVKYNFSFVASGASTASDLELAYDTDEPKGVLTLSAGDKVAVAFDGVQGSKLKNIKVALRQAGTVNGGIYRWDSSFITGALLFGNLQAVSNIAEKPGTPYPIPWPNWVEVDLSSQNIDTGLPFVVSFNVEGTYPENNRVMITYYQSSTSYHSFFYQSAEDKWVYYSVQDKPGFIFLNLIRATVTVGGISDAEEEIDLIPSAFSLDQNYPNPFNPSTIISYNLAESGNVQIKIYDSLGKEVRSLIDEHKNSGKYNIMWDSRDNYGKRVASGVYFYTIKSGSFSETKKMVLMK